MLPDFATGGHAVRSMLATERLEPGKPGSAASVRGHIWAVSDSVNSLLQFYFTNVIKARKPAFYPMVNGHGA